MHREDVSFQLPRLPGGLTHESESLSGAQVRPHAAFQVYAATAQDGQLRLSHLQRLHGRHVFRLGETRLRGRTHADAHGI